MIHIDVTRIPQEMRNEEFQFHYQKAVEFFNSSEFDRKARTLISLHEGTHLLYARELGFEPKLYGPGIRYARQTKVFHGIVGAVQALPDTISMTADPIMLAKQLLGPECAQEKLLGFKTTGVLGISSQGDIEDYEKWFVRRMIAKGDLYLELDINARDAAYKDLGSPAFRRKLWDAAHEFEERVFGKPDFLELLGEKVRKTWEALGVSVEPQTPDENGFSFSEFINQVRCSPGSAQDKDRNA